MLKRGLMLGFVFLLAFAVSTPWANSEPGEDETRVPAYHLHAPANDAKLPPILGREQLWGANDEHAYQGHAYELAAKIPRIIYQQPCYCYCDRMGHKSLHSCFEDTHGAQCSTCLKELYYAYRMTRQRKTAAQIRKGIMAGEWQQIDLASAGDMN
jgi:hypothetical protein